MTTNYMPDGRPPTVEDILKLAHHNYGVRALMSMYQKGDMTWDQALMSMVLFLATQTEGLTQALLDATLKQKTVHIFAPPPQIRTPPET